MRQTWPIDRHRPPSITIDDLLNVFPPPMAIACLTNGWVAQGVIDQLAPTMANMSALGLLDKMYVYGFDEMPEIYNQVRKERIESPRRP